MEPAPAAPTLPAVTPEASATQVPSAPVTPPRVPDLSARRRELTELNQRLAGLKGRYAATKRKELDVRSALAAAELQLEIRTAERRVLELKIQEVARSAAQATAERDASARQVLALRTNLSLRISALYRMGRLGYLRALVASESGKDFLRGLQVLTHLASHDSTLLSSYESALKTLAARERELAGHQSEMASLIVESRKKEKETASARTEKAELLRRIQWNSEKERVEVVTLEDKSTRLTSLLDLLESNGRTTRAGSASIRKFQGVLDWPARGKVAVPYGRIANPKFPKTFLRSSGWTIDLPAASDVQAVFAGDVVFASWLKGYGNLVVLDHGEGVFTLYGRLATGTIKRGERVSLGERVGRLGESPEDEVPGLYFEIRDNRTSQDPRLWLR